MSYDKEFIFELDRENDRPVANFWKEVFTSPEKPTVGVNFKGEVLFSWSFDSLHVECDLIENQKFEVFYETKNESDVETFSRVKTAASKVNSILSKHAYRN